MNFFQHQDLARSKTKQLVFLFAIAVILMVLIISIVAMVLFAMIENQGSTKILQFSWEIFVYTAIVVLLVILIISLLKGNELRLGGKVIAEKLGGRLISPDSSNIKEKRLINVVEEISIASGVAVPPVYVINESGINAFAAGFDTNDAVIGVTRGVLDNLNRDELQGVIAHEFSHIFNGDMRLNIKLIAILHGLLFLGISGYYVMRSTARGRQSKDSAGILIFGLALMVVGYVGTFFGKLIKASVSRQREYLADASAVQYTRNPLGILSALKKIAVLSSGSKMTNPKASEFSHMFFSDFAMSSFSLTATHPPIEKRIWAIDPQWDGIIDKKALFSDEELLRENSKMPGVKQPIIRQVSMASAIGVMMQNMGNITQNAIQNAHNLIATVPVVLKSHCTNPFGARAVIYSLLMDSESNTYDKQLQILEESADKEVLAITKSIHTQVAQLDKKFRLLLIDLSVPSLKQLSDKQYVSFKANVDLLVNADGKVDFFEWSLVRILANSLDQDFIQKHHNSQARFKIADIKTEVSLFLSLMAYVGHKTTAKAQAAFEAAVIDQKLSDLLFTTSDKIKALDAAAVKLSELKPLEKEKFLKACCVCITQNDVSAQEVELLRAFSCVLGCPMPLLETA